METKHTLGYVPIQNQKSTFEPKGGSKIYVEFTDGKPQIMDKVTVWFVVVDLNGEKHDAVLKVYHNESGDMERASMKSARALSTTIWQLWRGATNETESKALISAPNTAVVTLDGSILNVQEMDHRDGDELPLAGKKLAGVLLPLLGHHLANPDEKYVPRSEPEVLNIFKSVSAALDAFQRAQLVHCDLQEHNIVEDPTDGNNYVLIDYDEVKPEGSEYYPLSTWSVPRSGFEFLWDDNSNTTAWPINDRFMLFFACIRLLGADVSSTKHWKNIAEVYEKIENADLKSLLLKSFPEVLEDPLWDDKKEPLKDYLYRRLTKARSF